VGCAVPAETGRDRANTTPLPAEAVAATTRIRAELNADPPLIAMSQVSGEPLGTRSVTEVQEVAIAAALGRLHHAIPPPGLATIERVPGSPHLLRDRIRDMAHACNAELLDTLPHQAYRAALAWLNSGWAEHPVSVTGRPVTAQCDPNLANHLWDGHSVDLVDYETSGRSDRAHRACRLR
jgi:hypothetical protein